MSQCTTHPKQPLTHYCETCSDVICELCFLRQPHSGDTHKIRTIEDSANLRRNHYLEYLQKQINPFRTKIQQRVAFLKQLTQQYQHEKTVIQKDIDVEFQAINRRLGNKVSENIIQYQTHIKHYEMFINTIDDLIQAFQKCFQHPQAFLTAFKMFDSELKKLEALKPLMLAQQAQKELQLQRQIFTTYQQIETLPQHKANNEFMNSLIVKMVNNYKKQLGQAQKKVQEHSKNIKQLYNATSLNLIKSKTAKICIFCSIPYTQVNLNEQCTNNRTFKMKTIYPDIDFTKIVPEDHRGSRRHFWYISQPEHRRKPDLGMHSLLKKNAREHYRNGLRQLETLKYSVKKYEIQHGKTLLQLLNQYDKEKTGVVSKVAFVYILNQEFNIPQQQIQTLCELLHTQDGIQYTHLPEIMSNPLNPFETYTLEQEQLQKTKPIAPITSFTKHRY